MGFFGTYLFDGRSWSTHQPDSLPATSEPWLVVDIHDSDIATITYRPAGPGTGVAYLGHTPRTYFEDPQASAPTDVAREAAGLATWWALSFPGASDAERGSMEAVLAPYLAADLDPGDIDEDDEDDEDLDEAEIFVEIKTSRFLATMGLPLPDELSR
jgi:hypothetical protein